ncbi:hypothetical protein [Mesorhizobium neociceri]|uniref:hypothetical protein n=1 Tax=Mesorhizobium neociceri TaxID=1307853 RepID=UPI0015E45767|nr:hypothetical protein [Mesorhizobium neociceri]
MKNSISFILPQAKQQIRRISLSLRPTWWRRITAVKEARGADNGRQRNQRKSCCAGMQV